MHRLQYEQITNHTNIVTGLPTLLIDYTTLCMSQNLIFLKVESMTDIKPVLEESLKNNSEQHTTVHVNEQNSYI